MVPENVSGTPYWRGRIAAFLLDRVEVHCARTMEYAAFQDGLCGVALLVPAIKQSQQFHGNSADYPAATGEESCRETAPPALEREQQLGYRNRV